MTRPPPDMELRLTYAHGVGDLQPYFEALGHGRALASRCSVCGRVWFPPHIHCPADGGAGEWVELDGRGEIVSATRTHSRLPMAETSADHVFVLVAMDGADNAAFGRLRAGTDDPGLVGRRVGLAGVTEAVPHPAQGTLFELLEEH